MSKTNATIGCCVYGFGGIEGALTAAAATRTGDEWGDSFKLSRECALFAMTTCLFFVFLFVHLLFSCECVRALPSPIPSYIFFSSFLFTILFILSSRLRRTEMRWDHGGTGGLNEDYLLHSTATCSPPAHCLIVSFPPPHPSELVGLRVDLIAVHRYNNCPRVHSSRLIPAPYDLTGYLFLDGGVLPNLEK